MVYRYDGCINSQIRRRFWPSDGARSPYYDRLSRLISAGFLRATRLPSRTWRGSGPSLLTLGPAAHPVVRQHLGLGRGDLKRVRHGFVPMFWEHDAACRDVRLDLELACEHHPDVELVEWIGEEALKRQPITVGLSPVNPERPSPSTTVELVPDGLFRLCRPSGHEKTYYFELDRGTEQSPRRVQAKLQAYLEHLSAGTSPVLYVVETEARRAQLVRWVEQVAIETRLDARRVAIALRGDLNPETILTAPIWHLVQGAATVLIPQARSVGPPDPRRSKSTSWYAYLFGEGAGGGG